MKNPKTIKIDDIEYVRTDEIASAPAVDTDGRPYVIVRSSGAGVFAGYLIERDRSTGVAVLTKCNRLWRWTGASLSQVARDGIAGDGENKFGVDTFNHEIAGVLEVIPATEKARVAIERVKKWEV